MATFDRVSQEKKVFTAAKTAGIENYFVELEQNPALMAQSVPYLKSLQV